ncbi:class I SAM-dependent methyltransferase [Candidatus Woesearchaeota archaeon]|nr:class I SAM-dependent methyltransferase [Candidatus Woesearchaeota archaeon]
MFRKEWNLINKPNIITKLFGDPSLGRRLDFQVIKKLLKQNIKQNSTILDAGCGQGFYSFYIDKKYDIKEIDAIDYEQENVDKCKLINNKVKSKKIIFRKEDMIKYKKENKYDLIFALASTHYVGEEDNKIFENFYQSLRNKGTLLLVTPNSKIRSKEYGRKSGKYEKQEIIKKLQKQGFKITCVKPFSNGITNKIKFTLYKLHKQNKLISKIKYATIFLFGLLIIKLDKFFDNKKNASWLVLARK